jgi:hypothetical protein
MCGLFEANFHPSNTYLPYLGASKIVLLVDLAYEGTHDTVDFCLFTTHRLGLPRFENAFIDTADALTVV